MGGHTGHHCIDERMEDTVIVTIRLFPKKNGGIGKIDLTKFKGSTR